MNFGLTIGTRCTLVAVTPNSSLVAKWNIFGIFDNQPLYPEVMWFLTPMLHSDVLSEVI